MFKRLSLLIVSSLLLSACTIPFINQKAGIQIASNPRGLVTINSQSHGQTPVHQQNLKAGDYSIKISPLDTSLQPWEGKITLTPGTITAVDRQLAVSPDQASGYILYFEKLANKDDTEVNVTSLPSTASVLIDGNPQGFTPYSSSSVKTGPHTITITATGFQNKVINALVKAGYRLNINTQLAIQEIAVSPSPTPTPPLEEATPSATPTQAEKKSTDITPLPKQSTSSALPKPYVQIKSPTLGWLRVRQQPSPSATEIVKVNDGDKFPYLKSQNGWYQIEYKTDTNGWISASYATLVE